MSDSGSRPELQPDSRHLFTSRWYDPLLIWNPDLNRPHLPTVEVRVVVDPQFQSLDQILFELEHAFRDMSRNLLTEWENLRGHEDRHPQDRQPHDEKEDHGGA